MDVASNQVLICTLKNDIKVMKRKRAKVVRHIRYNKKFDEENFYCEKLLLFYPWRKESGIYWKTVNHIKKDTIKSNMKC